MPEPAPRVVATPAALDMSAAQSECWQHAQLIIDVVSGRGGMVSLEGPEGLRFLARSRRYDDAEFATLAPLG